MQIRYSTARLRAAIILLSVATSTARGQLVSELAAEASAADARHACDAAAALWRKVYEVNTGDPSPLLGVAQSATCARNHDLAFAALTQALAEGLPIPAARLQEVDELRALHDDRRWAPLLARAARLESSRDSALRAELLQLGERDQRNRDEIGQLVQRYGRGSAQADSANAALAVADAPLQARLREIVRVRGWPTRALVGDDAAHAAWLLLQHSAAPYQREMLPRIQALARRGQVRAADAALLEDRVRMGTGQLQRYGSQLRNDTIAGAPPAMYPIENAACVDERRAEVLLPPLADYLKMFGVPYSRPPGTCRPAREK